MATCQGCGARVTWLRNVSTGGSAPVDPTPSPTGNVVMRGDGYAVLTKAERAELDAGPTLFDAGEPTTLRYTLHFATCPHADHFRRCKVCHHTPCNCPAPS